MKVFSLNSSIRLYFKLHLFKYPFEPLLINKDIAPSHFLLLFLLPFTLFLSHPHHLPQHLPLKIYSLKCLSPTPNLYVKIIQTLHQRVLINHFKFRMLQPPVCVLNQLLVLFILQRTKFLFFLSLFCSFQAFFLFGLALLIFLFKFLRLFPGTL